jgi:hypothetical protein
LTNARAAALAAEFDIDPNRPLLIVDADEVLFHFMSAFLNFIEEKGHAFVFRSYALAGNVLEKTNGTPLAREQVTDLVSDFFKVCTRQIPPDLEAASVISRLLADGIQGIVLSNVPLNAVEDRRYALADAGINLPLAPWSGPKGPAVAALAAKTRKPTAFVDDIASHHESVAELAPAVYRLHYVTHPKLRQLLGAVEAANAQAENWGVLDQLIRKRLIG